MTKSPRQLSPPNCGPTEGVTTLFADPKGRNYWTDQRFRDLFSVCHDHREFSDDALALISIHRQHHSRIHCAGHPGENRLLQYLNGGTGDGGGIQEAGWQ